MSEAKAPITRTRTWKEEVLISEKGKRKDPVYGYEFSNKRKFVDKVDKNGSYE